MPHAQLSLLVFALACLRAPSLTPIVFFPWFAAPLHAVVQACRYFIVYLQALKSVLASEFPYPSLEMIKNATPEAFKKHFPGRTIQEIIDAHEQEMQVPSCLVAQRSTWSKYKHRQTAKFLGGKISPLEVPLVFLNTTSFDSKTAAPPPTPRW